ncbi:MAG: PAS domain S-box protein [Nitrospirae bacterium]|nr:MAG: PAS domain S-box protein [Nitrospirota bacterium]
MSQEPTVDQLQAELAALRSEVAELRAVHQQLPQHLHTIELQLAGIIHSAMDAIITIDEDQRVVLFNTAAEQMFGYSRDEALGQPLDQFLPDRFRQVHREHVRMFGETHITNRRMGRLGEISGLRKNGQEFPIEAAISQVTVEGKKLFTVVLRDITERKRAEQELAENRRFLATLIGNLPGMVYRCKGTPEWVMEFVSDGAFTLCGFRPEELVGRTAISFRRQVVHPDDREYVWRTISDAIQTRTPFQLVYRIKTAQNTERWVWEQGCGIFSPDGALAAIEGFITDITERKKAEDALQESSQRLELALKNASLGLWDWNISQGLVVFDRNWHELLGYSPGELPSHVDAFIQVIHPDDRTRVHAGLTHVLESDASHYDVECRAMKKDGSVIWIHARGRVLARDERGNALRLMGTIQDITPRKYMEHKLRESETRFTTFMNNCPALAWMKGFDGRYVYINHAFEEVLHLSATDCLGKTDFELWPHDIAEQLQATDQAVLASHKPMEREERLPSCEGEPHEWLVLKFPVPVAGEQYFLGGFAVDITQRKRLEEQLQKTQRLAELGTLASGMAHEIGTPMNVILGRAEFLKQKVADPKIKKGLETIVTQVERITKIMNQLLSFARRRPLERRPIDLATVIPGILDVIQERLKQHSIRLETDLRNAGRKVYADPDHMTQMVLNLVINAIQAMPQGGTLRLRLAPTNSHIELAIADTGCGIPEEHRSKLFDPFFTTKPPGEGTGLGLTVVHGIVQEHDGRIEVESTIGKGTTFRIFLPAL